VLDHHHAALEGVQTLDIGTRRRFGEGVGLDGFEFTLQCIDDREMAVHHGIHQRVQNESGAELEQFRLPLAALAHAQEALLAAVACGQHVVAAREDVDFADIHVPGIAHRWFDQVQHGEEGGSVFLDLWSLVAMPRILHRQWLQSELVLHLGQFGGTGVLQRDPHEHVRPDEVVADFLDRDVDQLAAVLVRRTVDEHRHSVWIRSCRCRVPGRKRWGPALFRSAAPGPPLALAFTVTRAVTPGKKVPRQ
jgi:hypothetical protein